MPDPAESVRLAELRVSVDDTRHEVERLRSDLAPLVALPTLVTGHVEMVRREILNIHTRIDREVKQHAADMAELQRDIEGLITWQTWALRLVLGAVLLAVVGLVLGGGQ